MKSRMAGSVAQARRSAARVNSDGTPGARKGRMSVAAGCVGIGGSFARSTSGSGQPRARRRSCRLQPKGPGRGTSWSAVGAGAGSASSRLRRDQRRKIPHAHSSTSLLGLARDARAPPDRLVALALEKRTIDVMFPHE
jgi:hypothetical protein